MRHNTTWLPEWATQKSIWLVWPHRQDIWQRRHTHVCSQFIDFLLHLSDGVHVDLLVQNQSEQSIIKNKLSVTSNNITNSRPDQIDFHIVKTNDIWIRDYGPFWLQEHNSKKQILLDFRFNAWGEKYHPYFNDDQVSTELKKKFPKIYKYHREEFVLEGGAIDTNGEILLASRHCIFQDSRKLNLNEQKLENILKKHLGVHSVLWFDFSLPGDDTDGHIDMYIRFVSKDTIVYNFPKKNHIARETMNACKKFLKEKSKDELSNIELIEIPMPKEMYFENSILPATYANFLISNHAVFVPVYNDPEDKQALLLFESIFEDKTIQPIYAGDFITQGGALHCMTMPEF